MVLRRTRRLGLAAVLVLGSTSCKKDETSSGDDGAGLPTRSRSKGPPPRLDPERLDDIGEQPGFLADGMIFAAVRAGAAQDFLRQLPLPSDVTRDLSQARRELGFDLLGDDVLERFAIPRDAIISMTLGRPLGTSHTEPVKTALRRDDRFLKNVGRVLNEQDDSFRYFDEIPPEPIHEIVEIPVPEPPAPPEPIAKPIAKPIVFSEPVAAIEEEPPPPPPHPIEPEIFGGVPGGVVGGVLGMPYDPTPPPLSPAERKEVDALLEHADAMAMQLRVHIPTDDPSKLLDQLRTLAPSDGRSQGEELCRSHETELCIGERHELFAFRRDGDAVVVDVVAYSRSEVSTEVRKAVVAEALAAEGGRLPPAVDDMAGDASLYVDAEAMVDFFDHERTAFVVRSLGWSFEDPRELVDRRLKEDETLRRMMKAPRLFDGVLANAHHDREHSQLQITWPLRDGQEDLAEETLTPPKLEVRVPTLDALCDGALLCARSRGMPRPETLGTSLAQGIYGSADALEDAVDDADEAAVILMMIATWPNALGTGTWHLPLAEARGPEAAIVRGLIDAIGRVQGLGLSVRRLDVGRRSVQAEYAAYARVPSSDLALVGTMLSMAQMRMTPTSLDGVDGEVMMLRVPEDDVPAVLMTRKDPDPEHGWLSVVDSEPRFGWLLGLDTDDGEEPMIYAEIPELWRLVASFPEAVDELGFARTWASERSLKASLHLDDGQPHLWMEVARVQPKAKDDD